MLIVHSPQKNRIGDVLVLTDKPVQIGRGPEGQVKLVLDDDQVSRRHAQILPADASKSYQIQDLDSSNGTFINGTKVASSALHAGDVLRLGAHMLLYQVFTMEECRYLLAGPGGQSSIVGPGVRMHIVRQQIKDAGLRDVPVLILGESGVGKELVARELHKRSGRSGECVAVNCAALPEHLVESELFGHISGAFTGASGQRPGLFVEAENGTLFLDEIGETPLPIQAKLLRALATGEVRAVGATRTRTVNTRVVAATNVNLEDAVDSGAFRADLYARLLGVVIPVPPLRKRREDVLPLTSHFLSQALGSDGAVSPTPDVAEALLIHGWRFNVRELEHLMRTAAPAAQAAGCLDLEHLPEELRAPLSLRQAKTAEVVSEVPLALRIRRDVRPSAEELEEVLTHFSGNVARVGEFFGKDRRQIYRWADRLGVDLTSFRSEDS